MVSLLLAILPLLGSINDPGREPWGVDADLAVKPSEMSEQPPRPTKICQSIIRFYQNHISPINGPRSSYLPSSSQYTFDAIGKYGVFKGIVLGCDRLMRENGESWFYPIVTTEVGERKIDPVR